MAATDHEKYLSIFALFVIIVFFGVDGINVDYGGWKTAHATFYGGGDASGRMERKENKKDIKIWRDRKDDGKKGKYLELFGKRKGGKRSFLSFVWYC
ncbi:hypothetical protein Ddye_012854 [Dipteronia dyeriana]|uniref:Uncharacterized protein n=1 Tax=Dipteronia dyeriana TaxID=168575 RepID=A0AAD9X525_9ROSI|nr:hypothetical protein Ddye_012854 [Dipteronia dyeriana]